MSSNNINTIAPIDISDLKKYFSDKSITYTIDYKNSKLKETKLLTYLSNLDLPCDISIDEDGDEFGNLLSAYFNATFLVNIPLLEQVAIDVLLEYRGVLTGNKYTTFIENNKEIIEHWTSVLDSLVAYNLFTVSSPELKEWAENLPHDDTSTTDGINFVNLLKYPEFYSYYETVNEENLKFYDKYFTHNMFKGTNLFNYWANDNNPMFLLTVGIVENMFSGDDYVNARTESIKEIHNASPI